MEPYGYLVMVYYDRPTLVTEMVRVIRHVGRPVDLRRYAVNPNGTGRADVAVVCALALVVADVRATDATVVPRTADVAVRGACRLVVVDRGAATGQ